MIDVHTRFEADLFAIGDYLGASATGAATAGLVRAVISPDLDMVLAMVAGMALGMIVHIVLGLLLSPVLGMFHVMVPGSLVGMYGGMLFAMRDSMGPHAGSWGDALVVGIIFGLIVTAGVHTYDRVLRGSGCADRAAGR